MYLSTKQSNMQEMEKGIYYSTHSCFGKIYRITHTNKNGNSALWIYFALFVFISKQILSNAIETFIDILHHILDWFESYELFPQTMIFIFTQLTLGLLYMSTLFIEHINHIQCDELRLENWRMFQWSWKLYGFYCIIKFIRKRTIHLLPLQMSIRVEKWNV